MKFWSGKDWQCSPVEKRCLQAAAGQLACRSAAPSAVKGVSLGQPLELEMFEPLRSLELMLVARASVILVPSQTAGLVCISHKTRFDAY